jgi:hypothetical protein
MKVAVAIVIRVMIVLDPFAARTLPIACIILLSVMVRPNPEGTLIRRTAIVALMPSIMTADRIPVAANPCVSDARTGRLNVNPRRRRRPDAYTDRYPAEHRSAGQQR